MHPQDAFRYGPLRRRPLALLLQNRYLATMLWHVLHLRPRCEKKTAEHCTRLGLSHFLPLRSETKIYQRRKVTVDLPVFPGYIFAAFDQEGRVGLLKTNHILRVIEATNQRHLLHELAQIRRALRVDPSLATCRPLMRGHTVRITGGPFMGVEGIVSGMKGDSTVRLNVDMIGQAVAVDVAREFLEQID